ncbi:MAG: VOC family protein [Rubrobacteraceae bacterium]
MGRVVHFEVSAEDPQRAGRFYEEVFGWESNQWDGPIDYEYWLVKTGAEEEPGIDGAIVGRGDGDGSSGAYVCVVGVDSLDESLQKVEQQGGEIVSPKESVAGVGSFAYCRDPEGNVFGLIQDEEQTAG